MKKYIFLSLFLGAFFHVEAQVHGVITGQNNSESDTLIGAQAYFLRQQTGVLSDVNGHFKIDLPSNYPDTLIFRVIGYYSDTFIVTKPDNYDLQIKLYANTMLKEVVLVAHQRTSGILRMESLSVENLSSGELRKAACCNLSESFSTNASVDVNTTDAVSGARRIQLMGLDGVYTQIQFENIPIIRGLESSFGLAAIPGTWVESIQITKGTGNVVNGYESMAGLVNI
ncbi:MAG: carboxypeptidase-like regulatory domain-containing protein, partial [Crocinitomicaceae bacterium]